MSLLNLENVAVIGGALLGVPIALSIAALIRLAGRKDVPVWLNTLAILGGWYIPAGIISDLGPGTRSDYGYPPHTLVLPVALVVASLIHRFKPDEGDGASGGGILRSHVRGRPLWFTVLAIVGGWYLSTGSVVTFTMTAFPVAFLAIAVLLGVIMMRLKSGGRNATIASATWRATLTALVAVVAGLSIFMAFAILTVH